MTTTAKQILKDEKILADLRDLFKGDVSQNAAFNVIAMYGEDGADIEYVAQRLIEELPWAEGMINEIVR